MLKILIKIFNFATIRFFKKGLTYQASALAYISLLAIVPVISVIFYFVSLFPIFSDLIVLTQFYIYHNFLPSSSERVEGYLTQFMHQASTLPVLSICFSILSGLLVMMTVEHTLDKIWGVTFKSRVWVIRLKAWGILLIVPFFIGFISFLLEYVLTFFGFTAYYNVEVGLIHFIINVLIFTIIYKFVPNTEVAWTDGLIGGITAAILFELVRQCFQIYVNYFSAYQLIYGAISFLPIFFIWVYLAWCIIIFSALVVHAKITLYSARKK